MNIQPLYRQRHGTQRWNRNSDFGFTATTVLIPLAAVEVARAAISMPLAFIRQDENWSLAAVLGLMPDQNLYAEAGGRWLASYVPSAFRAYPFRLGQTETGNRVLCVDEGSGLIVNGPAGEPFFDEMGLLSSHVAQIRDFLAEMARSETILADACAQLNAAGVISPWQITVESADGLHSVGGLHKIDESILNGLDDVTFLALRKSGLVGLAYAQLMSMGNLADLGRLAQARAEAEAAERARAEVKPMISLPEDSSIDWDWSKIGKT